ncbi:MAG: universal stress protein [Desulfarculaceae bacterium]|nr:universal stress protein [Desulfarculaceae bacterium]MCF8073436.1 universal stress protein [Desulfarculaceae bacterium]MCF8100417.1 universal stress protein [Desulfarculaceae bacterium]MCF8115847.1 universal stress protein [Desulfarculaceae bacterium]
MLEFRKILFPVDLSEVSPKLVEFALTMAQRFSAELHVINVVRTLMAQSQALDFSSEEIEQLRERYYAKLGEQLDQFVQKHLYCYQPVVTAHLLGDPADGILDYIEKQDIDLVVMGTHGRKGLDKIIFGSVAQRVVQMSPAPVLTVNPHRLDHAS